MDTSADIPQEVTNAELRKDIAHLAQVIDTKASGTDIKHLTSSIETLTKVTGARLDGQEKDILANTQHRIESAVQRKAHDDRHRAEARNNGFYNGIVGVVASVIGILFNKPQ